MNMLLAIWLHLYNFENVKNTHGRVFLYSNETVALPFYYVLKKNLDTGVFLEYSSMFSGMLIFHRNAQKLFLKYVVEVKNLFPLVSIYLTLYQKLHQMIWQVRF